jgi:hypothetical protein
LKTGQILFFVFLNFAYAQEGNERKKKIVDFDATQFSIEDFKIYSNAVKDFQVWKSTTLTAPASNSKGSLLLRIKNSSSKIPIEFLFKSSFEFEDFVDALEFTFYSSGSNSELYFYFDDTKFIRHKILVSNLKEEGWKSVTVSLPKIVSQIDYVNFKKSKTFFVGLIIETNNLPNLAEFIIGFDNINGFFKPKILLP